MTNPLIKRVAESTSIAQVADIIKCGFEFEYQGFTGEGGSGDIDYDALSEAYCNSYDEDDFITFCEGSRKFQPIYHLGKANQGSLSLFDAAEKMGLSSILGDAESNYRERWESDELENNRDDYVEENDISDILPGSLEYATDSSVSGGELRTMGANSPSQFVTAAKWIDERKSNFSVDGGCSFHIHLSIAGITHAYGKRFQAEMIGHLMQHSKLLSEGPIHQRIKRDTNYFKFQIAEGKYTAIHFHSLGTWEFRVFGNIKDLASMQRSLLAAYAALRHAYRVKLGLSDSIFPKEYTTNDISNVFSLFARIPSASRMKEAMKGEIELDNDMQQIGA